MDQTDQSSSTSETRKIMPPQTVLSVLHVTVAKSTLLFPELAE